MLLILPLKQWIIIHIQGVAFLLTRDMRLAQWFFWLVLLPGTLLHEVSHWVTAKLLLVKTHRLSLWPKVRSDGWMEMGAVHMEAGIDPFRHSLIGLAPLIFGTLAVLVIGHFMLGVNQIQINLSNGNFNSLALLTMNQLMVPSTWLWLYLIFTISNSMFPSSSDRQAWRTALLYLALVFVIPLLLGITPTIPSALQSFGLTLMTALLFAFSITLVVNLVFMGLIIFVESVLSWFMGRQVTYNRS
ncbi:hypothetical protein QUF64_10135 [Anaerolineales bacterium HSG6]|nr:hypothetical protein [Anaerolineales bacterium HSG6]MDM8531507.1 hypothetical protein [Anaerolineales bacterium HSG25]